MTTQALIDEAVSLPVEQRVLVVDALLQTLNRPDSGIDCEWADLAQRRLSELREGNVQAVPGEQVFQKLRKRFG